MKYTAATGKLAEFRDQIAAIRKEMRKVQAAIEPQEVADYVFATSAGETCLSNLFGKQKNLFVVHNMGAACAYCTLWADGYNGIHGHLVSRAAFVVSSPDPPDVQAAFAARRGWRFPMVSHAGTSFAQDMGYRTPSGAYRPGISAFRLQKKRILRVSDAGSLPRDDFSALWHLFDLLPEGPKSWQPQFSYAQRHRKRRA